LVREDAAKPMDLLEESSPSDAMKLDEETDSAADKAKGVFHSIRKALDSELRKPHLQLFNGGVALVFGLIMIVDGYSVFKWLVAAAAFLATTLIAHNESMDYFPGDMNNMLRRCVGVEAGLLAALAALQGFEGLMVVLAGAFGSCVAYGVQEGFPQVFKAEKAPWVVFALYTICTLYCTWAVARKKHYGFLGFFSSFLGGALTVSAVSFFATFGAVQKNAKINFHGHDLVPVPGDWIDFFLLLWHGQDTDVGFFANEPSVNTYSAAGWPADRIIGCVFWFFLFVIGAKIQSKKVKAAEVSEIQQPLLPQYVHSE